jgi:hypothetical protein
VISARIQLRIVALFYLAVAALGTIVTGAILISASHSQYQADSPADYFTRRASERFPSLVAGAVVLIVLSFWSFRLLTLSRPWRIIAVTLSSLSSLSHIVDATRNTLIVTPKMLPLTPDNYQYLVIELAVLWAIPLAFSLCSFVLWKHGLSAVTRSNEAIDA